MLEVWVAVTLLPTVLVNIQFGPLCSIVSLSPSLDTCMCMMHVHVQDVCVCVCVCVCACKCMFVSSLYVCAYTHKNTQTRTQARTHKHTHTHTGIQKRGHSQRSSSWPRSFGSRVSVSNLPPTTKRRFFAVCLKTIYIYIYMCVCI